MDYTRALLTATVVSFFFALPVGARQEGCSVCDKMWVLVVDAPSQPLYQTETISISSFGKQYSLLISSGGSEVRLKAQRMSVDGDIVTFYGHNGKILLQVRHFPKANSFQVISIVLNDEILKGSTYTLYKSLH